MKASEVRYFDWRMKAAYTALVLVIGVLAIPLRFDESLDRHYFYTGEYAHGFLTSLSLEQNQIYLRHATADLVFILVYSTILWLSISRLASSKKARIFSLIPGILDLAETSTIIVLLQSTTLPQNLDWLGILTCTKWTSACLVTGWSIQALVKHLRAGGR